MNDKPSYSLIEYSYGTGFNSLVVKGSNVGIDYIGYSISSSATTTAQIEAQVTTIIYLFYTI